MAPGRGDAAGAGWALAPGRLTGGISRRAGAGSGESFAGILTPVVEVVDVHLHTTNHAFDPAARLLHMRLYYQPVDEKGRPAGPERIVRLCHRQLWPGEVRSMLETTGFRLIEAFAGFDGTLLVDNSLAADEHVYVAVAV